MPGLFYGVLMWAVPAEPNESLLFAVLLLDQVVPLMLLLVAMRSTARICGGVDPVASFLVVLLPLVLLVLVEGHGGLADRAVAAGRARRRGGRGCGRRLTTQALLASAPLDNGPAPG